MNAHGGFKEFESTTFFPPTHHQRVAGGSRVENMVKSIESKPVADDEGIIFLQEAFNSDQVCLEADLRASNRIRHQGDKGEVNEQHFI